MGQRGSLKSNKMDPELNENENRIHPNLAVDMTNAVLREAFIALNAYIGRQEKLRSIIQEPRKRKAKLTHNKSRRKEGSNKEQK